MDALSSDPVSRLLRAAVTVKLRLPDIKETIATWQAQIRRWPGKAGAIRLPIGAALSAEHNDKRRHVLQVGMGPTVID